MSRKRSQQAVLVFLCLGIAFAANNPVAVTALTLPWLQDDKKIPAPLDAEKSLSIAPAADYEAGVNVDPMTVLPPEMQPEEVTDSTPKTKKYEEADKRTATTKTYLNTDGTRTMEYSALPKHYQKDGKWLDLNPRVLADSGYRPLKNLVDEPWFSNPFEVKPSLFTSVTGEMYAKLKPFQEGIEVVFRDKTITLTPEFARNVRPVKTTTASGQDIVTYKEAWPNVDVTYELVGNMLKETMVVKNKNAPSSFSYTLSKGSKVMVHPTVKGALAFEGISPEEFFIAPLSISANTRGVISEERATWSFGQGTLKMSLDKEWFASLKDSDFPLAVDPSFTNNVGGTYGQFIAYKSDGYSCNSQICDPQAGRVWDNGHKWWRTMFRIPFDQLQGGNKKVLSAELHLVKKQRSYWTGYDGWKSIATSWGPCFGFNCTHAASAEYGAGANTNDWTNVRRTVAWMAGEENHNPQWGGWFMMWGDESADSYKQFEPNNLEMRVTYDNLAPQPNAMEPADKQVITDTQPTLRVSPVADPDGDPLTYRFTVSTARSSTAGVIASSDFNASTQWTVPDNILQDGTTYYWAVTPKGASPTTPTRFSEFKVDMRTGKDSTQAYDTVGPIGVDLATGNATTSTGTHTMSALGGTLGLTMNYNSPAKTRSGLVGEYFNNTSYSGTPALTRVDRNIEFAWEAGSPYAGLINNDSFTAKWTGYFTAPRTGNYTFGAQSDDGAVVTVNGQVVLNQECCSLQYSATPVALTAGQTVPYMMQFVEQGGHATAVATVKSPDYPNGQPIPKEWFSSGVRQVAESTGLIGRYYKDDGSHNFPSNEDDASRLLMVRHDTSSMLNWGAGAPAPGLQTDNFMVRWRGYLTIPENATGTSFKFGGNSDDGMRIKLGIGGLEQSDVTVYDKWVVPAGTDWSPNTYTLTPGQQVPITIEYFEVGGGAAMSPTIQGPNVAAQVIPATWLSPKAQVLPSGWDMGIDADGNVNYEKLKLTTDTAILSDSTGQTHEYKWTGSAYKPPVNEDGTLVKVDNGKHSMTDTDGRVYIFGINGNLESVTTPQDDRQPAALKYIYSANPARLTKIEDGVTNTRYATIHYKGINENGNCSVPTGFDAAPTGMMCAFKTSDGDLTKVYYKANRMARVEKPGSELMDFGYDMLGRIVTTRDSIANDAVSYGVRTENAELNTEVSYDSLGRVTAVKAPAPIANASRVNHTFEYVPYGEGRLSISGSSDATPVTTPVNVSWGGDRQDLFARASNGELIHKWFENGSWSSWESLGGCIIGSPGVASWAPGRLDVLVRNCAASGNNLSHRAYDNGQWYGWGQPTGSIFALSDPSIVSWGYERLDYAIRGSNGELYHSAWAPGGWSGQSSLGGCISNSPRITSPGFQKLDIVGIGCTTTVDNVYTRSYRPTTGWSAYVLDPGMIASDATIGHAPASGTMIAARQLDGTLKMHRMGSNTWESTDTCINGMPTLAGYRNNLLVGLQVCGTTDYAQRTYYNAAGTTKMHVTGATEPHGFSKKVEYDTLLRTLRETDLANLSKETEWDGVKDLSLSTTDATGMKSTTIYDADDRPIESYGPAPKTWFGSDRKPTSTYASQVPKTSTAYDEGMTGLAASYYNNKKMLGTPKLYQTLNWNTSTNVATGFSSGSLPITPDSSQASPGWAARYSGKIKLTQTGNYNFRLYADAGVRMYIDDTLVIDDWGDGTLSGGDRSLSSTTPFNNITANSIHRVRIDHYHGSGTNTTLQLFMTAPGATETGQISNVLSPGYNLTTSTKAYDALQGDVETKTVYSAPEYGTVSKTVLDPAGLNLETNATYESPGTGFLRQTSKTLPGGSTTTYQHYTATDTRDNPCTTNITEAFNQAGRPKGKVESDPDGAGPLTGRSSETIYNEAGEIVATRFNTDAWTCTTYDTRGRVVSTTVPSRPDRPGRTINNNYAYSNNPLITMTADVGGAIYVENDLLGRTVTYTDTNSKVTTNTYDSYGKLTSRTSPLGTESYTYDTYDRLTVYKLDNVTFATVTYDQFSRLATVAYGAGINLSSITRDSLGRENGTTFTLANNQTLTDSITRAVSGDITSGTENSVTKNYTYDNAGRLTAATVAGNTFSYEFGTVDTSCNGLTGNNPNAGKSGNRTKMVMNGVATTYCYDMADRLIASSDARVNAPEYDSHGNTTLLGSTAAPMRLQYDASDRNTGIEQYSGSGNGTASYYARDAQDRISYRLQSNISNWNWTNNNEAWYGFTGSGDTPDFVLDSAGNVTQKYLSLPGDVVVTIKPNVQLAGAVTYSLPNIHGDVYATVNADGSLISTHVTGPFGEELPSQTTPNNTVSGTSYNYVGQHQKLTESTFDIDPIQMGARVYIGILGRFLTVDPIEGGTANNYAYALDPINEFDLDGKAIQVGALVAVGLYLGGVAWAGYDAIRDPNPINMGVLALAVIPATSMATLSVKATAKIAGPQLAKKAIQYAAKKNISIKTGAGKSRVLNYIAKKAYESKTFGFNSRMFGANGKGQYNTGPIRVGWARHEGKAAFRVGVPGKHKHVFTFVTNIKWRGFR